MISVDFKEGEMVYLVSLLSLPGTAGQRERKGFLPILVKKLLQIISPRDKVDKEDMFINQDQSGKTVAKIQREGLNKSLYDRQFTYKT